MKTRFILILSWVCLLLISAGDVRAEVFQFGPPQSIIKGSVKYTVIGRYSAGFESFRGTIVYDEGRSIIESVRLTIETKSVRSNFPRLDKIVRSARVFDTERYPEIVFKSDKITKEKKNFKVQGKLTLRGTTRDLTFYFQSGAPESTKDHDRILRVRGKSIVARKDFGFVWNTWLDKGGILVGNHITIEWQIMARPMAKVLK